jgi:hypothetical protein
MVTRRSPANFDPGVHQVIKGDSGFHFAIGERVVFLAAAGDYFSFVVIEREAIRSFGNISKYWLI